MLEVSRQTGHSVAICERHYAGIFEDYDPANRTSAEAAIRAAREPGVRESCALVDTGAEAEMQNTCKPRESQSKRRSSHSMMQRLAPGRGDASARTRRPWMCPPSCPQLEQTRRRRLSRTVTITPSGPKLTSMTAAPGRRSSRLNALVTRTSSSFASR
jgi:hypothetical protein